MMLQRRQFLAGILASAAAPALCRAKFLMPVVPVLAPVRLVGHHLPDGLLLNWVDGSFDIVGDGHGLPCDGRPLLRANYPGLFAAIGTIYGSTSPRNFLIPDLRGQVVRA